MRYLFRDFELDPACFSIRHQGHFVAVEPRVLDLLIYLIDRRERMVPTRELLDRVWGGVRVETSALARCVCLARRLLGRTDAIRTVYARGYQWVMPITILDSMPPQSSPPDLSATFLPRRPDADAQK
jgi:DNA-binding winged helix-turn-helix (wHTH) protein